MQNHITTAVINYIILKIASNNEDNCNNDNNKIMCARRMKCLSLVNAVKTELQQITAINNDKQYKVGKIFCFGARMLVPANVMV